MNERVWVITGMLTHNCDQEALEKVLSLRKRAKVPLGGYYHPLLFQTQAMPAELTRALENKAKL